MLRIIAPPREILCLPRQGLREKPLMTAGMAGRHVSHIDAAQ